MTIVQIAGVPFQLKQNVYRVNALYQFLNGVLLYLRKKKMKLNRRHKEIRIVDVSVEGLMATLMELHEIGAEYIDLVLTPDDMQDQIGIVN